MKTILILLVLMPTPIFADDLNSANTAWILTSTALVLFMTLPGLALFYGGLVYSKNNVLSMLTQCFSITGIVSILWLVIGYSIAFDTTGSAFFGGLSKFMLAGVVESSMLGDIPESLFVIFQMTFAIITIALIIGSFAERMKFSAVLLFSALWLILVYSPIAHWVWGGGWLSQMGVIDFAGGIVVHITSGSAAIVAAIVLKHRSGFLSKPMPPHNMTITMIGAGMLWVGWFGFNGGSALAANNNAAMAVLVTHISAATSSVVWMFYEWIKFKRPTALGVATGMVAGLGAITPASGLVGPAGAIIIGAISSIACFNAVIIIKQKFKIDDSLDVFPVHCISGIVGSLLVAVFATGNLGVFSGQGLTRGMISQLGIQAIGIIATLGYTVIMTYIILKIVSRTTGLRITVEEEEIGLDVVYHE